MKTNSRVDPAQGGQAMKHTPGPWKVTIEEYGASGSITIDQIERLLHDTEWADPEDWERDLANAHLIAAAPDFHKAICDGKPSVRDKIAREIERGGGIFSDDELAAIDAAIAKSEGRG